MHFFIHLCAIISLRQTHSQKMLFEPENNTNGPFYWADGYGREPDQYINTFFDRVVAIYYENYKFYRSYQIMGVLISPSQILTSLYRFENLMKTVYWREQKTKIRYLMRRKISDGNVTEYDIGSSRIHCARAVQPGRRDLEIPKEIDHDFLKEHLPYHDLLVMKFRDHVPIQAAEPKLSFEGDSGWLMAGPIVSELARRADKLEYPIKMASTGHIDHSHIYTNKFLEGQEFEEKDDVIYDCRKIVQQAWGHFVCIKNIHNYTGLGLGAVLYSKDKLIGLGLFALWKGYDSYFVFTDLRPYSELILAACAPGEQLKAYNRLSTTTPYTNLPTKKKGRKKRFVSVTPDPEL